MRISGNLIAFTAGLGAIALVAGSCAGQNAAPSAPRYSAQTREFSVVAVPLLVHEQVPIFDYLQKAFAKKGLLNGKEVWGFAPNNLTVYQWDTADVSLVNPGDDPHTFTITELGVNADIKGGQASKTSFVANKVGTFRFFCSIPEHAPYMWGTLTVLPDSAARP